MRGFRVLYPACPPRVPLVYLSCTPRRPERGGPRRSHCVRVRHGHAGAPRVLRVCPKQRTRRRQSGDYMELIIYESYKWVGGQVMTPDRCERLEHKKREISREYILPPPPLQQRSQAPLPPKRRIERNNTYCIPINMTCKYFYLLIIYHLEFLLI